MVKDVGYDDVSVFGGNGRYTYYVSTGSGADALEFHSKQLVLLYSMTTVDRNT